MSEDDLLNTLVNLGHRHIVITDINNTSAAINSMRIAEKLGISLGLGIDVRNGNKQQYLLIAKSMQGYYEMCKFVSIHLHSKLCFEYLAPVLPDTWVVYPFTKTVSRPLRMNEMIGIAPRDLPNLPFSPWVDFPQKLVVFAPATFRNKRDYNAHKLMRAMANNIILSKLPLHEIAPMNDVVLSLDKLLHLYQQYIFIVNNTYALLETCILKFDFTTIKNKKSHTGDIEDDYRLLQELSYHGLKYRYPKFNHQVKERLEKELRIIHELNFTAYFLINYDIVKYAQHKQYFYIGRGSGANSIVAYCLQITNVDPIELDLYFERFINPFRASPPDFDIDFSWRDRDDITNYIFNTHSNEHTALLGAYNTFQHKAVIRELGKVFGLPKEEIDALTLDKRLRTTQKNISDYDSIVQYIVQYAEYLKDLPNYISIHSSGIIISAPPIWQYSTTFLPPKGYPTVHYSMLEAEDIGLYKFDILSQRGLGHIKDAVSIIKSNKNISIDIHQIDEFKKDPKILEKLAEGDCMGCFYIESPAMRQLLKKMQCADYLSLVAASSIIRPGVARSGMMRTYIERYIYPEKRKEAHPVMAEIMPDTFGIMVYQEDVIKVAHYFAGLSLAESDVLRRGMSGKYRSREEFAKVEKLFYTNCAQKGYDITLVKEIWNQIESFAGYSFAKGHSASYAVESFQSLFLKTYYPLEFMTAVLNNFGGFYDTSSYLHEAKMCGASIEPPCVNASKNLCTIIDKKLYLGYILVKQLPTVLAENIVEAQRDGLFLNMYDFVNRVSISLNNMQLLIKIGAFRFTKKNKKELMWDAHLLLQKKELSVVAQSLFIKPPPKEYTLPLLVENEIENAFDELELLGFSIQDPFSLVVEQTDEGIAAKDLSTNLKKNVHIYGNLITTKPTRTIKGEVMYFGTFYDKNGCVFDTVHFPPSLRKYYFKGRGIYELSGRVTVDFNVYAVEVDYMQKMELKPHPFADK